MVEHIPPHPVPPPPPSDPALLPPPPDPLPLAGWLRDPAKDGRERYWDGAAWTDRTRSASGFKRRFGFSPYWLLALLVGMVILWGSGIFDDQLVDIGLNARDCFDPDDGPVVCGSEAQELIEAQENPIPFPAPTPGTDPFGFPTTTTPGFPAPGPGDPGTLP